MDLGSKFKSKNRKILEEAMLITNAWLGRATYAIGRLWFCKQNFLISEEGRAKTYFNEEAKYIEKYIKKV